MSRIVVGVDGSPQADDALRWAVREADLRGASVELVHAYVVEVHRAALAAPSRALGERTMHTVIERNRGALAGVKWESTLAPVIGGSFSVPLIRAGDDAALVVVGSRGLGGFRRLLLGSTSYRTAAHATCPVAVIRGQKEATDDTVDRPVVVGIDGSRVARRALQWALDEAALRDVRVIVVHAYSAPPYHGPAFAEAEDDVERRRVELRREAEQVVEHAFDMIDVPAGVVVERAVVPGSAAGAVLERGETGARLVVVGSRGHGAVGRALVGSVSQQVLQHATGPVVVVP